MNQLNDAKKAWPTSLLARFPTYTTVFISGSHFLNSFAQLDKVERGTTTRKGPWICWAYCNNRKHKKYASIKGKIKMQTRKVRSIKVETARSQPEESLT